MTPELLPIPTLGSTPTPELESEAELVLSLTVAPLDPSDARRYARRKYLIYFFISVFAIGLPVAVFSIMALGELGLPKWLVQGGIALSLALAFAFFFAMIVLITSRNKILRPLGIKAIEIPTPGKDGDVFMVADRHGRRLEYGVGPKRNFWRYPQNCLDFRVEYRDGAFFGSRNLPPSVQQTLGRIPPSRQWRKLKIHGGPEGLNSTRPVRLAKYFLQDLWLLEKILAHWKDLTLVTKKPSQD